MSEWQPIETAPYGKTVLLFAITDTETGNWKMATGSRPFDNSRPWNWGGYELRPYDVEPTHWMPLPEPPK
jgi:hypothetical protein